MQLAGPFIQAARGEVDIVRAATTALSMARADAVPAPVHEKYAAAPTASDTTASMLQRPRPKAGTTHGNGSRARRNAWRPGTCAVDAFRRTCVASGRPSTASGNGKRYFSAVDSACQLTST